ncbi:MAG: methyltransferase domain-containing protein [Nitrospirota bacterium]|mgnify:FL=1
MEERKKKEKEFHNRQRTVTEDIHVADTRWSPELESTIKNNPLWANMKYYSIERKSRSVVLNWLQMNCKGKKALDYCCGNGDDGIFIARNGASDVTGIDISEISIKNCKEKVDSLGLKNITYRVMDAEALDFENETFDIVTEYGALHHLDLNKAYSEISRVMKFNGKAICTEALGHNKIFHLYRRLTPHLRTEWEAEHILRRKDIELAKNYFNRVEILGFFHLATIAAVPFRNLFGFNTMLGFLELMDSALLKLPLLKWQAWQVVFVLSQPKKETYAKTFI